MVLAGAFVFLSIFVLRTTFSAFNCEVFTTDSQLALEEKYLRADLSVRCSDARFDHVSAQHEVIRRWAWGIIAMFPLSDLNHRRSLTHLSD